ncbi:MAG: type II/IV secretion system protein [Chloroflexota bacterium]|nr:type II/IV secretion system protein [Chloroflexota bacterium]
MDATATLRKRLGQMLVEAGLLSEADAAAAAREAAATGRRLGEYVVEQGLVSAEALAMTLSLQLGVRFLDLLRVEIDPAATKLLPADVCREHVLIPVETDGRSLLVVMADPNNMQTIEELRSMTGLEIRAAVGIPDEIRRAINLSYHVSSEIEREVGRARPAQPAAEQQSERQGLELQLSVAPIVRTADLLLAQAVRDRASDIHLEPEADELRVRLRIDGVLHESMRLPKDIHAALISRFKVMAGMNIAERRRPQDGQISTEVEGKRIDLRAATSDSAHGEMLVLRVLDKSVSLMSLRDLGFSPSALDRHMRLIRSPFGMVLVSGPTGSGKTTTLYASVNQLNDSERKIITIEDPIEYQFAGITQIQVNPKADITFASGLRSIMRLDPDVILVGEVRDAETARIASQAALTGHLVLSSIHANDAVGVLMRLADFGIEPFLAASSLIGVVAQRMVRRVCRYCAAAAEPGPEEAAAYETDLGEPLVTMQRGDGCNLCAGTGFLGRVGVFEILTLSAGLRRLMLSGASAAAIRELAVAEGMVPMRRDGMLKAKQGIVTPQEILRGVYSIN